VTVVVSEPTERVVYYEGSDSVTFDDLAITVTDPSGQPVAVRSYRGDLVYEKVDLTTGRAVATFQAESAGSYIVHVKGVDTGQFTVGDSYAKRALPGVLIGLGIAAAACVIAVVICVATFTVRNGQRNQMGGSS
jgi:hypothetical protein